MLLMKLKIDTFDLLKKKINLVTYKLHFVLETEFDTLDTNIYYIPQTKKT